MIYSVWMCTWYVQGSALKVLMSTKYCTSIIIPQALGESLQYLSMYYTILS